MQFQPIFGPLMIQFCLQIKKNFDPIPKQVGSFAGPVMQANGRLKFEDDVSYITFALL